MKVSLIIPVYNVENYVDKCLKSVEQQTCKELEVIIINDGSTDESYEIVRKYVERNTNFQCYSIENRGLGGARNYGLEKASGEYVCFLDSDDYIASECIEAMLNKAKQNKSDIVVCNSCDVTEDGTIISYYKNKYKKEVTNVYEEPTILFNRVSAWGKLYKKELFNELAFVSREWYEDMRMTPKLFLKAKSITYIDNTLFYYVQRSGSIMNNSKVEKNIEITEAFDDLISYFYKQGVYERFREVLEYLIIEHVAVAGISRVALYRGNKKKEVLHNLQKYLETIPNLYKNSYVKSMDKNRKLILLFNKYRLYCLSALCLTIKSKIQ